MTAVMNNKRLTVKEMFEKYPDQWLFIIRPEICKNTSQLLSGIVQVRSSSRNIVHKASKKFVGGAAIKFTGDYSIPEDKQTLISYRLKNTQ